MQPQQPPTGRNSDPKLEKEKVEKVVAGEVTRRKSPLGKRLKDTFIGGDAKSVWGHVVQTIIIPTVKDTIVDIITQGAERTFYGDTRPSSRRGAIGRIGVTAYTAYNKVQQTQNTRPDPRPQLSRQARTTHNFDEILLDSRADADTVIDKLMFYITKYGQASVADLLELVGVEPEFTDDGYGWVDIENMGVSRVAGKYLLDLPQPVVLREA